jgi:hypothetical protein
MITDPHRQLLPACRKGGGVGGWGSQGGGEGKRALEGVCGRREGEGLMRGKGEL